MSAVASRERSGVAAAPLADRVLDLDAVVAIPLIVGTLIVASAFLWTAPAQASSDCATAHGTASTTPACAP